MMTYLYAFLIGGGICVIGQILMDATKLTAPRVLVILVTAGALMQAFHLYEPLVFQIQLCFHFHMLMLLGLVQIDLMLLYFHYHLVQI